jgi:hypothetical protein
LKLSPMSSASRPIWYDGCAMEKLFARRLDMSYRYYSNFL